MEVIQSLRDNSFSAALWQLEGELLIGVCRQLKCSGLDSGEPHSKTKRALIKMAEDVLDEVEINEKDESVVQFYKDLSTKNKDSAHQDDKQTVGELEELSRHDPLPKSTQSQLRVQPEPTRTLQEVTLRREFKISGQIGVPGERDKLSYLSLVRQIELGTEKGHSETEMIEAVIRAISPGLPLRDMLEIKRGLTLGKLLTILKGHYKVDSPTELYHQLLNVSQEITETALNFVFRAIELKEKLLWKAANEETDELYSRSTIQRKSTEGCSVIQSSISYCPSSVMCAQQMNN